MFEDVTFDSILNRMLERVQSQMRGVDTREGSIIYNALAPAAVELTNMYIQLDAVLSETFAGTASRDYLILRAAERGVVPHPATPAIAQGEFNIDVPIGSRFSLDGTNFYAQEKISAGVYRMACETPGTVGNVATGDLIAIDYVSGLTSAELTQLLIPGEDEEDTEHLRSRYFDGLDAQAYGGNVKDYEDKVSALPGVGAVKVYPAWQGGGTVRLAIIASDWRMPTAELLDEVQTAVDPIQNQGVGAGIAPIGHSVTVTGVAEQAIDIAFTITYATGWDWSMAESGVRDTITKYMLELAQTWAVSEAALVRISQIESRILDCPGIIDVTGTTINGVAQNYEAPIDVIPVLGVLSDG